MFYHITDRDSYLQARAHWRLNYAALSANQRNVKAEISNNQRTFSKKEVFSYDWPAAKQQAWLAAYGQDGAFRTIHGALAYQKKAKCCSRYTPTSGAPGRQSHRSS